MAAKRDTEPWEKQPASAWREVWGRVLGETEDPLGWGFGIGRYFGVRVRVSLWFALYAAGQVVWSISFASVGPMYAVLAMVGLFVVVVVHEFGHVAACRLMGGKAEEVLLWPMGGMGWFDVRASWKARVVTSLGGFGAQLMLFGVMSGVLWKLGYGDLVFFNVLDGLSYGAGSFVTWWGVLAWWVHSMNIVVMVLNVLPMLPLDGARVMEGLMSRRGLERDVRRTVAQLGLVVALGVVVVSLPAGQTVLLGLGVCCAMVCWSERQRMRAIVELSDGPMMAAAGDADDVELPPPGEMRREKKETEEQERVEEILEKIAREGMGSLNVSEKKLLERVTRRKRREVE